MKLKRLLKLKKNKKVLYFPSQIQKFPSQKWKFPFHFIQQLLAKV